MAWKACKQYRRPDIGITALRNQKQEIIIGKDINKEMLLYMKKSMGNRRTRITKGTNGYRDAQKYQRYIMIKC